MPEEAVSNRSQDKGRLDPPRRSAIVEPKTKGRIDPPAQHVDAISVWGQLVGKERGRHYVFANNSLQQVGGVEWYKMMGYRVEIAEKDGVRPKGGATVDFGQPIQVMGMTLMSCTKERKAELDAVGFDGVSGQRAVDEIEDRIIDKDGGIDESRGIYGRRAYYSVHNETKPLEGES